MRCASEQQHCHCAATAVHGAQPRGDAFFWLLEAAAAAAAVVGGGGGYGGGAGAQLDRRPAGTIRLKPPLATHSNLHSTSLQAAAAAAGIARPDGRAPLHHSRSVGACLLASSVSLVQAPPAEGHPAHGAAAAASRAAAGCADDTRAASHQKNRRRLLGDDGLGVPPGKGGSLAAQCKRKQHTHASSND